MRDFSVRKLSPYEQDGADWKISAAVVRQISRDAVFSGNFKDCVHKGGYTKALLHGDCYEERSSCCCMTNSTHIHLNQAEGVWKAPVIVLKTRKDSTRMMKVRVACASCLCKA